MNVAPRIDDATPVAGTGEVGLFDPVTFRSVTAKNRVMMSPMCQYSATDGLANEWHRQHLAARALGGSGIVCVEATHVEARGRISPGCLGLWNEAQRDALAPAVDFIASAGAVPAIQLAHAGRKASSRRPWDGPGSVGLDEGGWTPIGASPIPLGEGYHVPTEMDDGLIGEVTQAFRRSAEFSLQAGFRVIEIHAAHGYLLHSFLSPLTNRRSDRYGGSLENRSRLLHEVIDAVREVWPDDLPLFVRLSCTDWARGGLTIEDTVVVAAALAARGDVDLVDCSSGGAVRHQQITPWPGYQVPFAARIRAEAGIATGAVGLISTPHLAEYIVRSGSADLVLVGRALLANPSWTLQAAKVLEAQTPWPKQYERAIL